MQIYFSSGRASVRFQHRHTPRQSGGELSRRLTPDFPRLRPMKPPQVCLSRRDQMMVARHEMPGKSTDTIRPVGNGVIRGTGVMHRPRPYEALATYHTVPSTGRDLSYHVSRHFMPGYLHLVPTGQRRTSTAYKNYDVCPDLLIMNVHGQ